VTLLSLENVSKRYRRGPRELVALRDVSLEIGPGELAAVLGTRKSGRSTLLRIAAGLERPDEGRVLFEGVSISAARNVVGQKVVYCRGSFSAMEGDRIVDHVSAALLAQRMSLRRARRSAESALERCGALECASMRPDELSGIERIRVAIARALVPGPRMLVIDDPAAGVGSLQRDAVLRLLRAVAADGIAVLFSTDEPICVAGTHSVHSLDAGQLRGTAPARSAEVLPLRRAGGAAGARLA
jgi:ABC-type lipoprotein export system ATPase subunit